MLLSNSREVSMKPLDRMCAIQHIADFVPGRCTPDLWTVRYVCQRTDRRSGRLEQWRQGAGDIGAFAGCTLTHAGRGT